jgi:hypothetical protein
MKKILLPLLFFALLLNKVSLHAQCNFISPTVELNQITTPVSGFCDINFNLSFEININSGNKYTFVHLWRTTDYDAWVNNPAYNAYTTTQNTQPEFNNPGGDDLNILQNAVATIILNNDNVPITFETTYGPDPDAPVKTPANNPGLTVVRQTAGPNYRYTISNLVVRIPTPAGPNGCATRLSFTGDAWSSQANNGNPPIHCAMAGWTYTINDVTITGFKHCINPIRYAINISTTQTTPFNIFYDVYVDNGDGVFNPGEDFLVVNDKGPFTISAGSPYSAGLQPYDDANSPYATAAYKDRSLWYVVTAPTVFSNIALYEANNACATLPVEFKSFTAARSRSNVLLRWETSSEINNSGFAVERNMNGAWEQIAFINSQATNGNSDHLLTYTYNDLNNTMGITQYRIKQVDFDNKSKYSEIRSVRGDGQIGKTIVYPNPTADGRVNVVFEDASVTRNIAVVDMSGRIITQSSNITNNNITIGNLMPGMYSLRVMVPETGEQTVLKIVVNKR